jgi:archaemetzincin
VRPLPTGSSCVQRRAILAWPLALAAGACESGEGGGRACARRGEEDDELAFRFDPRFFERKHAPRASDWMGRFQERGQSFFTYVTGDPVRPTERRRALVLQPLGPWAERHRRVLEALVEFMGLFFGLPARLSADLPLPPFGYRYKDTGAGAKPQYQTGVLLDKILAPRLPDDAVASLGITMADLFPSPAWNFVFGEASFERRVGVYSLVRYTSEFQGEPDSPAARGLLLRRACVTLAHETGHMFSMQHCPFYECLMNGSNSLDELDHTPGWLCPVCLKKLHWNLGFGLGDRYRKLAGFYRRHGLADWAAWMDARHALLQARPRSG